MRFALLLIFVTIGLNSKAQSYTITVLNGWKSTPLENCHVFLENLSGELLERTLTDSNGVAKFNFILENQVKIYAIDSLNRFENDPPIVLEVWDQTATIILSPNYSYERKLIQIEDSIYLKKRVSDSIEASNSQIEVDSVQMEIDFKNFNRFLREYVRENTRYPEISLELGQQGIVYVEFVLELDGTITGVRIARGLSVELDRECKRLIRSIPNLSHLFLAKRLARMRIRFPVIFTLQ